MELKIISTFFTRIYSGDREMKRFEAIENLDRSAKVMVYAMTYEGSLKYDFMERKVEFADLKKASEWIDKEANEYIKRLIDDKTPLRPGGFILEKKLNH